VPKVRDESGVADVSDGYDVAAEELDLVGGAL
jgi:hypothetical protein